MSVPDEKYYSSEFINVADRACQGCANVPCICAVAKSYLAKDVFEPTRRAESTNTGGPSHSRQDRPRLVDDWATPDTTCINWSPSIKPATDTAYTRLSQDSTSTPDTSHNTSPNYTFDSRCGILYDMPNPPRMPELSAYANVARLSSPSLELSRIPLPEPIVIQQRAALVPWISPQLGQTRHAEVERITEEVNGNRSMTESQSLHLPAPTTSMASKSVGMYSSKIELPFRLRTRHEETYSGTTNNTPSRIDIDDESTYDSYDDESAYDSCDLLSEPCDADSPNENTRGDGQHQSVSVNHETVSTGSNNKADKGTSLKRRWGGDADDDDNSSNKDRRNAKGGKYDHEYPCPFGQADPARYDSDACSRNTSQGISHLCEHLHTKHGLFCQKRTVGPPYIAHLPADDDEGWPAWARAVCLRCFNIFTIQADLQKHLLECQAGKRRTSNKDGRTNFGPQWDSLFRAFCGDSRPEWERHPLAQHAQQSHRLRRVRRVSQIPRVQPDQQVQQVQQIQQVQQVQQIQQVQQGHPAQFWPIDPALQDSARQSAPQTYQAIFPPAVPTSLEGLLQGDESTKAYIVHLAAELADVRGELAIRDAALAKSQAEVAELKAVIDSLRAVKLRWFKEAQTANEAHGATERDQASPVPDILVDDSGLAAPPETISDDFPPQHITYESWLKVPHLHDKATSEFSDSTFAFEDDSPGKDNVQSENQITGDKIIFSDDEEQHLVSYRENECTDGLIDDASIIKGS